MKIIRIVLRVLLLLFIVYWSLIMVAFPAYYDSHRLAIAYSHYHDAPDEATKREVEEAKKLDRIEIIKFELVGAVVLGAAIYGFIRSGRKAQKKC